MPIVAWVAIAVTFDGAAALVGGLIPDRMLERHRALLVGFAVGALAAAVAGDLAPEAWSALGVKAVAWAAGGAVIVVVAGRVLGHGHGEREDKDGHAHGHAGTGLSVSLLASDALHNFGDGMAIAAAFTQSIRLGVATSLAVIVHEVPEEVADYALIRAGGMSRPRALLALTAVQLTAALGAVATLAGADRIESLSDIAIAIAAGTFVAILAQLVPPLVRERDGRRAAAIGAAFGAAAVTAVSFL